MYRNSGTQIQLEAYTSAFKLLNLYSNFNFDVCFSSLKDMLLIPTASYWRWQDVTYDCALRPTQKGHLHLLILL